MSSLLSSSTPASVPQHVAIIMDGNGRWAQARKRPRSFGHRAGEKAVHASVEFFAKQGVKALTLFAFSSENWRRPKEEVGALMSLFLNALDKRVNELHQQGIRLRFIGDLSKFSPELLTRMQQAMTLTETNERFQLNVAVNYGGRADMARAARLLAEKVQAGEMAVSDIDEAALGAHVFLADLPEPDLFIRTGGEVRISNFLLWQLAYTELFFTDVLWPDVDEAVLTEAMNAFARRDRRFGGLGEGEAS